MSENVITDRKSAVALVKYERDRSKVVYSTYIAANEVTLETVGAHVKALTDLAFPGFVKGADEEISAARKSFMNRVRNGLNHTLGKHRVDAAARAESEEAATDASDGEEAAPATVEATPAQSLAFALQAAQAAGMTRDEILAVVADVVDVTPVQAAA